MFETCVILLFLATANTVTFPARGQEVCTEDNVTFTCKTAEYCCTTDPDGCCTFFSTWIIVLIVLGVVFFVLLGCGVACPLLQHKKSQIHPYPELTMTGTVSELHQRRNRPPLSTATNKVSPSPQDDVECPHVNDDVNIETRNEFSREFTHSRSITDIVEPNYGSANMRTEADGDLDTSDSDSGSIRSRNTRDVSFY